MSDDPLPLPDILAGSPDDADYEAIYAEVMATERGRRFLIEYASRNRAADAHMLAGTLTRVEAAMRGDPSRDPAKLARDFAALAAAIGRLDAEVAPDALEVAARELGDAFARNDADAERALSTAALLRDLAGRINAMIAIVAAEPGVERRAMAGEDAPVAPTAAGTGGVEDQAAEEFAEEEAFDRGRPPPSQVAEAEAKQDEYFAQAIGALAASFPAPAEAGEPEHEPPSESADIIPAPPQHPEPEPPSAEPINGLLEDVGTNAVVSEEPEPVETSADSELTSMEVLASGALERAPVEPPVVAHEQTVESAVAAEDALPVAPARPIDISSPTDGESRAGTDAETTAANEPHAEHAGEARGFTEPPQAHSSYVISVETLLGEALVREDLPSAEFRREEPPEDSASAELSSEDPAGAAVRSEDSPSRKSSTEQLLNEEPQPADFRSEQSSSQETPSQESSSGQLPNEEAPSAAIRSEEPSGQESSTEQLPNEEQPHADFRSEWSSRQETARQESSGERLANEEISSFRSEESPNQQSSSGQLPNAEVASTAIRSDERSSPDSSTGQLQEEELPSMAVAGEQASDEGAITPRQIPAAEAAEPTEPAGLADRVAHHGAAPPAQTADDHLADGPGKSREAERVDDPATAATANAVDAQPSGENDLALLPEARPAHALLPDTQPLPNPEEDPADLFEPLPPPISAAPVASSVEPIAAVAAAVTPAVALDAEAKQIVRDGNKTGVELGLTDADILPINSLSCEQEEGGEEEARLVTSAAEVDAAHQMLAAESPAPALSPTYALSEPISAPAAVTAPAAPTSAQPRTNLAAAARPTSRPAANDPLAALRALSEEELIALFS